MSFEDLGLDPQICESLRKHGFDTPMKIQEETIPTVLSGKDLVARSETGSGKTLAFGAPLLQQIEPGKGIQVLILTPTRELAEQVHSSLQWSSAKVTAVYGGVGIEPQIKALKQADIVVGTPGRVIDHLNRKTLDLSNITHFVLDEADRMLDMGFLDDVRKIMGQCPPERQTLCFSATVPPEVARLTEQFMNDPVRKETGQQVDPTKLRQVYYDVPPALKFSLLVHLLQEEEGLVMVFCNSRKSVDFVADGLNAVGIEATALHGGHTQEKRQKALAGFNKKRYVLVATDVAARGLDIPGVSHVYNYDIPAESKQYVHRIGRTARAGAEGIAINLLSKKDHENFTRVLRDNKVNVERQEKPYVKKVELPQHVGADKRGKPGQGRPGGKPQGQGKPAPRHAGKKPAGRTGPRR